jgi:hypothetical protein
MIHTTLVQIPTVLFYSTVPAVCLVPCRAAAMLNEATPILRGPREVEGGMSIKQYRQCTYKRNMEE